jgi:hypothetical protein
VASDVGIADVIRAWRTLEASSDEERRAIARLLGFELGGGAATSTRSASTPPIERVSPPSPSLDAEEVPRPAKPSSAVAEPIELLPFASVRDNPEPERLPMPDIERPAQVRATPLQPLFRASWTRALVSTLTARSAEVGTLDVRRTIELLMSRRPITNLPRLPRPVSATEVVAILDRAGSMSWFRADAEQLIARLDAVTRARVVTFEANGPPLLAAAAASAAIEDGDETDSRSPVLRIGRAGRVIGFSDLGLGSPWVTENVTRADAWFELAAGLRARGASLVLVTPIAVARIPVRLRRVAACVHWDRSTRPAQVSQIIERLG